MIKKLGLGIACMGLSMIAPAGGKADEYAEFGGLVTKEPRANGAVAIINQQSKLPEKHLQSVLDYYFEFIQVNFVILANDSTDKKYKFKVYIVDDAAGKSVVLVSPEERWASINLALIAKDAKDEETFVDRSRKELLRTIAWLCGSGGSQYPRAITKPMKTLKDLDYFFKFGLPPDVFARMRQYLDDAGVKTIQRDTYENACQEGWAPAPTNKWQKAIWDKVHAIPQKPIKIEYNEKRDKGK